MKDKFFVDVDYEFGTDHPIREQALAAIRQASLVICFLDDLAPNVVFEYGYAKALNKPCILLLRKGAVVDVKRFFPEDNVPEGLTNPPLDVDKHLADVKDPLRREYDHEDPSAVNNAVNEELRKQDTVTRKRLSRRVLEAWVEVWKHEFKARADSMKPLFDYILRSNLDLDNPLFGTTRKKKFRTLLEETHEQAEEQMKRTAERTSTAPKPVPDAAIEVLATLPPEHHLSAARRLIEKYPADRRLSFSAAFATSRQAEEKDYKDSSANEEAVRMHREFLKSYPKSPEAHNNYACLLHKLNRDEDAEKHFRKALDIYLEYPRAHYNYAILLVKLSRNEDAEKHYRKALDINPEFAEAHNNYALLLVKLNRDEGAEKHYRKALEINLEYPRAHYNYAILLVKLSRNEDAEKHYRKALDINPEDAEAHNNYATLLDKLNRDEEAEKHYRKALDINPELAEAWGNLGGLYHHLGRYAEARECYTKALELGGLPDGGARVREWLDELPPE